MQCSISNVNAYAKHCNLWPLRLIRAPPLKNEQFEARLNPSGQLLQHLHDGNLTDIFIYKVE